MMAASLIPSWFDREQEGTTPIANANELKSSLRSPADEASQRLSYWVLGGATCRSLID
jgi:hypothetical protein